MHVTAQPRCARKRAFRPEPQATSSTGIPAAAAKILGPNCRTNFDGSVPRLRCNFRFIAYDPRPTGLSHFCVAVTGIDMFLVTGILYGLSRPVKYAVRGAL